MRVVVRSVNDIPVANAVTMPSATIGLPLSITLRANDTADGGTIVAYKLISAPTKGTTSVAVNTSFTGGTLTYTANTGQSGSDSFTYQVQDNSGVWSNSVTVTIANIIAGIAPSLSPTPLVSPAQVGEDTGATTSASF